MKLAYFSPMPPDRTGIATYSAELVKALQRHCEVTVFTQTRNAAPLEGIEVVAFPDDPHRLKALDACDHALYHVGNNPWYHLEVWKAARLFPGTVCLHDLVVYYLAAGAGRGALLKELLLADPEHALGELAGIEAACPGGDLLRYPTPSRHPCILGLLAHAPRLVVHNETSARALRELGYSGAVAVVPLLHYEAGAPMPSAEHVRLVRQGLGYEDGDFVVGAFGFIGPTKRMDRLLEAVALVRRRDPRAALRLLVVGEGDALDAQVAALGLGDVVRRTGFVADEEFRRYLAAVDACANLRYPSHGESSASLVQAMALAKPCIVTDHAWFSELPDDTVVKVPYDDTEVERIARAIERLMGEPEAAAAVAAAARARIFSAHSPDAVAVGYIAALSAAPSLRRRPGAPSKPLPAPDGFSASAYLAGRVRQLVP